MRSHLTFVFIIAALLDLGACTKARKESRLQNTPEQPQAIVALKSAYAAFNRGDIDAAVESFDPQIEWSEPVEFPGGGAYHGRDEVKRYLTQSRAPWAEGSNEWTDVRLADVYTIRDGKIVQMRAFADRQEALRWVGVEDQQNR